MIATRAGCKGKVNNLFPKINEEIVRTINSRYKNVLERIHETALKAGRDPKEIRLVVVSKSQPAAIVAAAISAGIKLFGENYIDEALEKVLLFKETGVEWHMIGHLQSRKAEPASRDFALIHSLDSLKLAKRLDRFCGENNRKLPVLLECNISGEESKFGFPAWEEKHWETINPEIKQILILPNIIVKGLMTMPPYFTDPELTRPYFKKLRKFRDYLNVKNPQANWTELSMGTSVDFETAVQEGSTFVRIGEAILGPRRK